MLRVALATYLTLVTLAGPWFCCCTATRVVTWLARLANVEQPRPLCHGHSCCHPHRAPVQDRKAPDSPGGPSCPCREKAADLVAPVVLEDSARQLHRDHVAQDPLAPVGAFLPVAALTSLGGMPQAPSEGPALPFVTAEELLHALHILRC